ncbi:TPA: single-stranded DNA-binding protein [Candidatus Poribacteria bacterium]|nr:single-stranded DNA-binding protein [Candidatus Poribacteria bacterium]
MASLNKVILMGNLTRDPEVKYTTSGTARTTFGMAMNRVYTDPQSGERKEEVCFVDVTAFGRTAEICGEYLSKGRLLLLEGRLHFYSWETETGERRNKLSVVAENIHLLPRGVGQAPVEGQPSRAPTSAPAAPVAEEEEGAGIPTETEDDIPF